jgi:hypothetical protein
MVAKIAIIDTNYQFRYNIVLCKILELNMSMHLEGPWLSTTGRRKGKKKWASAEQKRQAEALATDWEKVKAKYSSADKTISKTMKKTYTPPVTIRRDTGPRIPSLDTGHTGAVTVKKPMQYTGDKIVGIGTMHKSNAVPIFSDQEAKDISSMRR